jgi:hypothetical protein
MFACDSQTPKDWQEPPGAGSYEEKLYGPWIEKTTPDQAFVAKHERGIPQHLTFERSSKVLITHLLTLSGPVERLTPAVPSVETQG